MSVATAALVLAWIGLLLLAFALAGVLRQLRDVQAALRVLHANAQEWSVPQLVRPRDGAQLAIVLLVDEHCPVCEELTPKFAELAALAPDDIDFVVLSSVPTDWWSSVTSAARVRAVVDSEAYHRLDPGWSPAVVLVDAASTTLAAEPAGSPEALRSIVEHFAGARFSTMKRQEAS